MKRFLLSVLCLLGIAVAGNAQTENLLSNSGFEEWNDSKPTDWATLSTSNATIEKSTDAHNGSYSVVVKGATSNKRFASKSYTLAAGTYTMSAFVKANGEEAGHYRLGYVELDNGTAVSTGYIYGAAATAAPAEWTEVTYEFTLTAETELAILVMNNKNGEGASFLIDDFTLTSKKEGGNGDGGTDTPETRVRTIADVIAAGAGTAAVKGTIVATYARGFLVNDGTGYILTYLGSTPTNTVGDVVTVSGTTSLYGGLLQFGQGSTVVKDGTATVTHPTVGVMSAADMDAYVNAPTIKYVEYTGTLTISGNYYNIAVDGATAIGSISYPNEGLVTAASGDIVKVTGYTIGTNNSKQYVNTMALSVEVVEATTPEPEEPTNEIYIEESFASDFGDFSQAQTVGTYEWEIAYSTAKITAYVDSTDNAAESWLISPSVDFTEETKAYIQFEYIIRYSESGKVADNHQLLVSKNFAGDPAAATWTAIDFDAVEGSNWTTFYTASVNIPEEFMGESELTFAFKYISTTKAGTWEVRNLIVAHGEVEVTEEPETPETIECTVAEALAAYVDGQQVPAIVTGYIVGAMNPTGYVAEFGTTTVATNILLSDNADENNVENCIIVQLPSGDIRTALNLVDTPDNYKKQIKITGSIEKYFQQAGLKSPSAYEFTGVTSIDEVVGNENAVKVIYDLTGRRIDNITKAGIYIVNGKKVLVK